MQHRRVLFRSNLVLAFVSLFALLDASSVVSGWNPGFRVYSLERRGVITMDRELAREVDPSLVDHSSVGQWIAANHIFTETCFGIAGLICATLNAYVLIKN